MSSNRFHLIDGIGFSDRFFQKLHRLWEQLGKDAPKTVADIQRARLRLDDEPSEEQWGIHFVPREIVASKDLFTVEGFQIHISTHERKRLRGKVLDFEDNVLVAKQKID